MIQALLIVSSTLLALNLVVFTTILAVFLLALCTVSKMDIGEHTSPHGDNAQ